mmetsp:Transcript_12709/g.28578  ORF Transcript_12709/g.28578 Transcript_12709/m.28578 type:complete len:80 (-) Transcript_12709:2855-3094(-)
MTLLYCSGMARFRVVDDTELTSEKLLALLVLRSVKETEPPVRAFKPPDKDDCKAATSCVFMAMLCRVDANRDECNASAL